MSLHTLANHIQSAGRGEDKMLVHMTPGEVHGLQALAKAHGGSLSVNPQTGLPEAGFLSSILPMIAGFGLTALTGGAINPMTIGLITGGGTALATGSLQKGLMAGLGAYGGAGLAGMAGLSTAATAAAPAASTAANTTAAVPGATTAATTAAKTAAAAPGSSAFVPGQGAFAQYAYGPNLQTLNGINSATTPVGLLNQAPAAAQIAPVVNATPVAANVTAPVAAPAATPSQMTGKLSADFKTLTNDFSKQNVGAFINEYPLTTTAALGLGYSALNPPKTPKPKKDEAYIRPYDNSSYGINPDVEYYRPYSNDSTAERNYFTGGLQAQPIYRAAAGGLTALAVGGPIETMAAQNAVGQNQSYPQAGLETSIYSNPMMQRPVVTDVINQGLDTNVDRYTGEERMADGGVARFGMGGAFTAQSQEGSRDVSGNNNSNKFGLIMKALKGGNEGYTYDYNPDTQQFTQTGGVGMKGVQAQPMRQAAPMQQPMRQAAPMQQVNVPAYQTPEQQLGLEGFYNTMQQQLANYAEGGMAVGGVSHLGDYSDGGRLLRGPGDGVSDSIPASIGNRRPARLADGEFVIPARIVSEIGNGSTEAGARKLYAMMNRVQNARKKSVGKSKVAVDSKAERLLPA